jgi:hypothetical protein
MALLDSFRKRSVAFVLLGLLFLFGAYFTYPASTVDNGSDNQWKAALTGSTWTFSRQDGSVISDKLRLGDAGRIEGYAHPRESVWNVRDKTLLFLGEDGTVTSRFPLSGGLAPLPGNLHEATGIHRLHRHGARSPYLSGLLAALGLLALLAASPYAPAARRHLAAWGGKLSSAVSGRPLAYAILAFWFFLVCIIATTRAYVPDEAWFLYEAVHSGKWALVEGQWIRQLLFHSNAFGYGGLWWSLYTGLVLLWNGVVGMFDLAGASDMLAISSDVGKVRLWEHATDMMAAPMFMMRILVLSSLAAYGILLVRHARSGAAAVLVTLALVTMPLAWWSGKLASPELMAAALFAIAVTQWFIAGRALSALVLASVAVAMKLTVAPVYIALVAFICWELWKRPDFSVRRLAWYAAVCVLVVLLSNTWLLYDPKAGIDQLIYLSKAYGPSSDLSLQSRLILQNQTEMWEGTNYGSLAYWSGGLSLVAVSLAVAFGIRRRLAAFLFVGLLFQYLFMLTQPPHAWYWFPVILLLLIPFSQLQPRAAAGVGVVLLICLMPFNAVRYEVSYKVLHLRELNAVSLERSCLHEKLQAYAPTFVYDMAAAGTTVSRIPGANWEVLDYFGSFFYFMGGDPRATGGKRLLLLGERSYRSFDQVHALAEMPGNVIGTCGSIRLIKIGD